MRPVRTYIKDPFPGLSHFFGAALSIVALIVLLRASSGHTGWKIAFCIYGVCMFLLYMASGMCHSIYCKPEMETWLDRFDYMAIFLLIAGTYTPVCLIGLRNHPGWAWSIVIAEWTMAAGGIGAVLFGRRMSDAARAVLYVCMGWLALIAAAPIMQTFTLPAKAWLFAGGALYSIGAVVFVTDKPTLVPGWFRAHDLWHVMVLGGSACHFFLMLNIL